MTKKRYRSIPLEEESTLTKNGGITTELFFLQQGIWLKVITYIYMMTKRIKQYLFQTNQQKNPTEFQIMSVHYIQKHI